MSLSHIVLFTGLWLAACEPINYMHDARGDATGDVINNADPKVATDLQTSDPNLGDPDTGDPPGGDLMLGDSTPEADAVGDPWAGDTVQGDTQPGDNELAGDTAPVAPCITPPCWLLADSATLDCVNANNWLHPCPSAGQDYAGQDGAVALPVPNVSAAGLTRSDALNGLTWSLAIAEDVNYLEAAAHCGGLTTAAYEDWRMPSVAELVSLLDLGYSRDAYGPAIDVTQFPGIAERKLWSDTAVPTDAHAVVNFAGALDGTAELDTFGSGTALCVRGSTLSLSRFVAEAEHVVDQKAGLWWQNTNVVGVVGWREVLAACEALVLDNHDDWRLPTIKELMITPLTNVGIATVFVSAATQRYWSATPDVRALWMGPPVAVPVWSFDYAFYQAPMSVAQSSTHLARCVRGP